MQPQVHSAPSSVAVQLWFPLTLCFVLLQQLWQKLGSPIGFTNSSWFRSPAVRQHRALVPRFSPLGSVAAGLCLAPAWEPSVATRAGELVVPSSTSTRGLNATALPSQQPVQSATL